MSRSAATRPTPIRLVIYDLDGTLVDAFEDIHAGVNHAMERFGLPKLSLPEVRSHVGNGARMLIRGCLGEPYADRFDEVYAAYRQYYKDHPAQKVHAYPDVTETLAKVHQMGIRQAVLTNKPDEVTPPLLKRLGMADSLDAIFGERPDRPRKPHPDSLLNVVRHFECEPAQCALVGDGPADHEVARAAGVAMVAVTWGQLTRPQALALRPAAVLAAMPELLDWLARRNR